MSQSRQTAFELDRKSGVPLSDQLVSRLKAAIVRGVYSPGETLPGIVELAEASGTSEKVSRRALRRLSDEGWTSTRRHVGSVVLARTGNVVRWRVLFFSHNPFFCYHTDRMITELRTRLLHEKGGVSTIAISRCRGTNSYLQLEELLKERWDLILENGMDATSRKMIEDAGARVVFDRHCFGSIPGREVIELSDKEDALPQIVRHYMNTSECARYIADNKVQQRRDTADRLAKEFNADGIIYEQMKYCDFWGFERALVSHIMSEEYGWPILSIDRLYNAKGSGQLRTRFQAFVESLEIKKIQKAKKGGK